MNLVPFNIAALAETDIIGSGKNIVAGAAINIFKSGGGTAQIFSDAAGVTPITLPTTADTHGELLFFIEEGDYQFVIAGKSYAQSIVAPNVIKVVDTFADIATTSLKVDQIVMTRGHTTKGFGSLRFIGKSGSVTSNGGTRSNTGTANVYADAIIDDHIHTDMFGISSALVNNATALANAASAAAARGVPFIGSPLAYFGISGSFVPPDNSNINTLYLKQLSSGLNSSTRTIFKNSGSNIRLQHIKVDRGGSATAGDPQTAVDAAGVWIQNVTGQIYVDDIEVFGDGQGTGIRMINLNEMHFDNFNVHDITYYSAVTPVTELAGGVSIENCTKFEITKGRISNILSKTGAGTPRRFQTDGMGVGGQTGSNRFKISGVFVQNVGEGIDVTGSGGNNNFEITGCTAEDCGFAGIKVANGNKEFSVHHNTIIRAGWTGIPVVGAGATIAQGIGNIYIHHNQIYDTGTNPEISGGSVTYDGIQIGEASTAPGTPHNIFVHDNIIVDRKTTKTMQNGIKYYGNVAVGQNVFLDRNTIEGFANAAVTSDGTLKLGKYQYSSIGTTGTFTHSSTGNWVQFIPNSTVYDDNALCSAGNFTPKISGLYTLSAANVWLFNVVGLRGLRIKKNGTVVASNLLPTITVASNTTPVAVMRKLTLAAGDVVTFEFYQSSGGNLDLSNTGTFAEILLERM